MELAVFGYQQRAAGPAKRPSMRVWQTPRLHIDALALQRSPVASNQASDSTWAAWTSRKVGAVASSPQSRSREGRTRRAEQVHSNAGWAGLNRRRCASSGRRICGNRCNTNG